MPPAYCGHCGGEGPTSDAHQSCRQQLVMEPPRYCPACRRRMKVQVTPLGWTAECSRHPLTSFCTDNAPKSAP
ncbi:MULTISPECIES: biotin synthase auxiliary protein BsaP [Paenarthrobacter]|uniref:biotin synthase auxiliary protein BsaP n=1 Tax=Paenarthrobacter TaxID=1742992 RepID=UPI0009E820C5